MAEVRLGLDVGTTSVKIAAYRPDGSLLASAETGAPDVGGAPGCCEQDMDAVWATVCDVVRRLMNDLEGTVPDSLGIGAQGDGLWAIDADGAPAGPAMLWNDTRAADDVRRLREAGRLGPVGRACHTALWPGTSAALWRWLGREADDVRAKVAHVFTCGDWIGWKLTGQVGTDFSNGSIPFLDFRERRYSAEALAALDCGELGALLPEPRSATGRLGTVTAEAARSTGLPEGLPVAVPTLDLAAMIVGMGMDQPGQTMMIMGTTAVVNILTDSVDVTDDPVGASALHPTSDVVIRILAPTTGAAAFDWFVALHPLTLGGDSPAEVAAKLNALVVDIPPGASGVVFLPYLNGERAPFVAADVTAAFHGLTARSTKADMGRAVMEGGAMSLRHCFESEGGLPGKPVQLTGGGSKNPVWCQIIADVVGATVEVSEASDQGLWGAASIGAAAAGRGDVMTLAAREHDVTRYRPDAAAHRSYDAVFARYRTLSEAARRTAADLRKLDEAP